MHTTGIERGAVESTRWKTSECLYDCAALEKGKFERINRKFEKKGMMIGSKILES